MPIQIRLLPKFYTYRKIRNIFTFINNNASLHYFFYLVCGKGVVTFNILDSVLKFYRKKYRYCIEALHLVEMEKDPDRQPLDAIPDPGK